MDPTLTPFGPPPATETAALNARNLARIARREEAYGQWRVGTPYRNVETESVRIHFSRSLGLRGNVVAGSGARNALRGRTRAIWLGVAVALATWLGAAFGSESAVALGVLAGLCGAALLAAGPAARMRGARPSDSLEDIASAVVEAMAATGGIDRGLGRSAVRIVVQPDGYYRCYLDGATRGDSEAFAAALDQVLAPLESPRYIIPRRVVDPPGGTLERISLTIRSGLGFPGGRLTYHAVPDFLAVRKERVSVFEEAWWRWVGGGSALFHLDPKAVGVLAVAQGENPFGTTSQMRTLWS